LDYAAPRHRSKIMIGHHPELIEAMQVMEDAELEIIMLGIVVENEGAVLLQELEHFFGAQGDILVV